MPGGIGNRKQGNLSWFWIKYGVETKDFVFKRKVRSYKFGGEW